MLPSRVRLPPLSVAWLATALFALAEAWLWWMYNFKWFDRESIAFMATVIGGAFALFAYMKGIEEKRSQAADGLIKRWNDPGFRTIIDATRLLVEKDKDSAELGRPKYTMKSSSAEDQASRKYANRSWFY